jgi:hypothetical protein
VQIRLSQILPVILWASVCGSLRAQVPLFPGVIRGVFIECDGPGPSGEFRLRAQGTDQEYRFSFDAKTYVEREKRQISIASVRKGDTIEVVSDRDEHVAVHYARTVHVMEARPAPRPAASAGRTRINRSNPLDFLAPRGNQTFAGVVTKVTVDRLVLRTRLAGEKTILLRADTRYVDGGTLVEAAELKPSTRVFVRAGENLDDQIEAYQIVWGDILEPTQTQ